MSRIRIKDIARIAEVSTGTVDRVIHHRSGVSPETRKKIEKLLKEYDYQPDIVAGMLAKNERLNFLVCMPDVVNAHEFWKMPERGIEWALEELSYYDVSIIYIRYNQHDLKDFQEKVKEIDPQAYSGLLFAPVFAEESKLFVQRWKEAEKPVVLFNSHLEGLEVEGYIGQDSIQSGYLGGRLMSYGLHGKRDVLIVNLSQRSDNYQHVIRRERGFRSFFEDRDNLVNNLVSVNINGGSYETLAGEIEEKLTDLDVAGIFVTNSRVHMVARYLAERGAMNIRLIGYDLMEKSVEYLERGYIDFLISQNPEEQSYLGLRQLYEIVALRKAQAKRTLLPLDVIVKENVEQYLSYTRRYE